MSARLRIHPFSLSHTLECGQIFQFTKVMDIYIVQSSNQIFSLYQKGDHLFYDGVEESFVIRFFRLEDDFDSILKDIDRDPPLHQAIEKYRGLRLIRQDPWECLVSFVCSSAKAIAHIRSIIAQLCRSSGKKIVMGNHLSYRFPEPQDMSPHRLESVGAGFRASYLLEVGRRIDRDQLLSLKESPYSEAKKRLMSLPGVGRKIADCVLLYSLDFLEAFPVDTWIKKGLERVYFYGRHVGEKEAEEFVSRHFGPFAGYAQLYLYHFWRHHPF